MASPVILLGAGDIASCSSSGDEQTASLLDGLLSANAGARIFADGDNAYEDGSAADFQNCYHPSWGRFLPSTVPVLGNHEYNTGTANPYFDYFNGVASDSGKAGKRGRGYYSYDAGAWHIVVLNANHAFVGTDAGTTQETWLRQDLAATAKPCILALWHQPRFYSYSTTPLPPPTSYLLAFWNDLYAAGADLIINGHHHYYERYTPQRPDGVADPEHGIRQFIVGTGGKSVSTPSVRRPNSEKLNGNTFGVIQLTLGDGTYSWRFIPVAGSSFTDAGSGTCHAAGTPQTDTQAGWVPRARIPTARAFLTAGVTPDAAGQPAVYVIGGYSAALNTTLRRVETYHPATDAWTSSTPLPAARRLMNGAATIDGKLYVSGGRNADGESNSLFVYDPLADSWTQKAGLPVRSSGGITAAISGKLYVLLGSCSDCGAGTAAPSYRLYRYDPASNLWNRLAQAPHQHYAGAGGVIDGKLYVAGGGSSQAGDELDVYDPATNTWSTKARMPTVRRAMAGVVLNKKLYVLGGEVAGTIGNSVEVYDPTTNSWSVEVPMPTPRRYLAAVKVTVGGQSQLLALGGQNSTASELAVNEAFTP